MSIADCNLVNGQCHIGVIEGENKRACVGHNQKCGLNYVPGTCRDGGNKGNKCWFDSDCPNSKCVGGTHVNKSCKDLLEHSGKDLANCYSGYELDVQGGVQEGVGMAPTPCTFVCKKKQWSVVPFLLVILLVLLIAGPLMYMFLSQGKGKGKGRGRK